MVRVVSAVLFGTILALAPASARAQDEAAPAKPAAVIKLDIVETVDGKPHRDTPGIYRLRQKLRDFGFVAWTEKPLRADEYEKRKREKEAAKAGATAATGTAKVDERPSPDLVIKGIIEVIPGKTSTFYGQAVAYEYTGTADLTITDAKSGKELAIVEERDEWGRTEQKAAREEAHKRLIAWLTAGVLRAEPIRGRLGPKRQAAVDEYVAGIDGKRASTAREREAEEGEDEKPSEGKQEPGDARKQPAGPQEEKK